jgi:hypothetical protein
MFRLAYQKQSLIISVKEFRNITARNAESGGIASEHFCKSDS